MTIKKDYKTIILPEKYVPKKTDEYMCNEQKAFFYQMLMSQKRDIETEMSESADGVNVGKQIDSVGAMDEGDAATLSIETDMYIKMHERNKNLMLQIDNALARLEDGTYGYSVISGDEIGLKRLMIRPVATMTMEESEEKER